MLPENPNLIIAVAGEGTGGKAGRVAGKVLVSSLMRNSPLAEVKVMRCGVEAQAGGLFKVERAGVEEKYDGRRMNDEGGRPDGVESTFGLWDAAEVLGNVSGYPWVLCLGSGSLVLRGVDHLLAGKADILWAPMTGVPVRGERCGYYVREEERAEGYRVSLPRSRPWSEAASAAVWAVRGEHFEEVMEEWRRIMERIPPGGGTPTAEAAWNRLLLDTPLKVARFERDEVQFPCLAGADFLKWKDAAILNVGDWPQEAQSKFLQAWFYGTYFADPTGLFLDIVEP